ncbi:MAG: class I tRNA ligase family protein, partial [Candidatus Aenigmatarchaeota archaeon]
KLMAPFTPHVCEELWSKLGHDGFVSEADWPEADEKLVDEEVEQSQELVERTVEDIRDVSKLVGDFDTIKIIVADEWKRELFEELADVVEERPEFGEAMGRLVQGRKENAETIKKYLQSYLTSPGELPSKIFSQKREKEVIEENLSFIENEFDANVEVGREQDSNEDKASRAEPGRPAIVME